MGPVELEKKLRVCGYTTREEDLVVRMNVAKAKITAILRKVVKN